MMEEESALLEDGEIFDSGTGPEIGKSNQFTQSRVTREPSTICSEESSNDNSDNSDEDSDSQCSKPKISKSHCQLPAEKKTVPNKYKVWSLAIQEESLMETLNSCGVEARNRERSVESYNYRDAEKGDYSQYSGYHMPVSECHYLESDFIRCKDEKQFVVGSKRRRQSSKTGSKHKRDDFLPRRLPQLVVTAENSAEEVAEDIALKLREQKVELILNIVLVLGKEKAIALYHETKGVEDNGGMLIMNQERRRTPGGVYLLLLKRDDTITTEAMKQIFNTESQEAKIQKKLHAKRKRRKNLQRVKETLIREKLLCLNTTVGEHDEEVKHSESNNLEEGELNVTNPPPSPATDQDTPPLRNLDTLSDDDVVQQIRPIVSYDHNEDYLEVDVAVDDMDFL